MFCAVGVLGHGGVHGRAVALFVLCFCKVSPSDCENKCSMASSCDAVASISDSTVDSQFECKFSVEDSTPLCALLRRPVLRLLIVQVALIVCLCKRATVFQNLFVSQLELLDDLVLVRAFARFICDNISAQSIEPGFCQCL